MSDDGIYLGAPTPPKKQKRKSGFISFFIILFALGAFSISPAPDYLVSLIPDNLVRKIISPIYQEVTLSETREHLYQPQKYTNTKNFNILGHNSGICFLFNKENSVDKLSKRARFGRKIAEVIAVSEANKEYIMDEVTFEDGKNFTIICQKFSRKHSLLPDQIKALYVRPLSPFSPDKIKWVTMKGL